MASHPIRLRKAWTCRDLGSLGGAETRLDLPLTESANAPLPDRALLLRSFATPPLETGLETLSLRLERVSGLRSIRFNDRPIPLPDPVPEAFEIPLEEMAVRNRLALEIDFDAAISGSPAGGEGWGAIALVIHRTG